MIEDLIETQIIDDALPSEKADELESIFLDNRFPWYYVKDVTYSDAHLKNIGTSFGFAHNIYDFEKGLKTSQELFDRVKDIPNQILTNALLPTSFFDDKYGVSRVVSFLQTPLGKARRQYDTKHVDLYVPHIVCLYYVIDASGDTHFFSKDEKDDTVDFTVTPKKNRAVVFDGRYYHASSSPESGPRVILNYNLISNKTLKEIEGEPIQMAMEPVLKTVER